MTPLPAQAKKDDESFWLQCNHCQKWRRIKSWDHDKQIPKFWFCRMNPDPKFNSCLSDEEPQGRSEVTTGEILLSYNCDEFMITTLGVTSGAQISNGTARKFQSFPNVTKETTPSKKSFNQPESISFLNKRRKI